MTAIVSDHNQILYTRDCTQDLPSKDSDIVQYGLTALSVLPFINIGKFRGQVITPIVSNLLKVISAIHQEEFKAADRFCHLALAITALAASIFQHKISLITATLHDILLEIEKLASMPDFDQKEILLGCLRIISNICYLPLVVKGGLELQFLVYLIQTVVGLIQSIDLLSEVKEGTGVQTIVTCVMTYIRFGQCIWAGAQLNRKYQIDQAIKRVVVGELGSKWYFTSDRVPIGVRVSNGWDESKIASFHINNVEQAELLKQLEGKGLNESSVVGLNQFTNANGLTVRDEYNLRHVLEMTRENDFIVLHEVSDPFLDAVKSSVPAWGLISSADEGSKLNSAILYDKYHANLLNYDPSNRLQEATFQHRFFDHTNLTILNVDSPSSNLENLAQRIHSLNDGNRTIVSIGNYNVERNQIIDAVKATGETYFSVHTPYPTTVAADRPSGQQLSIATDSAVVLNAYFSTDMKPSKILPESSTTLQRMIGYLQNNPFWWQ